jgi:AAA family ATP:ADP antiporter
VLQAFLTSRLLRWVGVGWVLAALPLVQAGVMVGLRTYPSLAMATVASAAGRAVTHAFSRPARETLFTAVDREDRFKTKNVIDTFVYRLGDTGSSWLHRGLIAAGIALTTVAVPLASLWLALALALGVGHQRRLARSGGEEALPAAVLSRKARRSKLSG